MSEPDADTGLGALRKTLAVRRELRERDDWQSVRLAAGLSRKEAADLIGVTPQALYFWEKHQREPRGENATKYGALLQLLREH